MHRILLLYRNKKMEQAVSWTQLNAQCSLWFCQKTKLQQNNALESNLFQKGVFIILSEEGLESKCKKTLKNSVVFLNL